MDLEQKSDHARSSGDCPFAANISHPGEMTLLARISQQVCRFLVAVLRALLPVSVLGGEDNFGILVNRK